MLISPGASRNYWGHWHCLYLHPPSFQRHRAVESAAKRKSENRPVRMAIVEYLVHDLRLDVNAMNTEGRMPNHWEMSLCYATGTDSDSEEIALILLERVRIPTSDCLRIYDPPGTEEYTKNPRTIELLRECEIQKSALGSGDECFLCRHRPFGIRQ